MVTVDSERDVTDPTTDPTVEVSSSTATAPVFISCCPEEMVEVGIEALREGRERARADGPRALREMRALSEAASAACDRALAERYIALDETRFRDVFTLAWCAGYREVAERRNG